MRAIDADELKEVLHTMQILQTVGCQYNIIDVIDNMKTLESRPEGGWIGNTFTGWECSCCGYGVSPWNNTPFCPNCGAKMGDEDKSQEESNNMRWDKPLPEQEESKQPDDKTFINIHDFNDGIFDPTYINDEVDCSDLGIYPWGDS